MTLDQLKIFIAVAECEHVTKAAAALNMTQSAVSSALQALQERHAISLFDRVGRRIELSQQGRQFLEHAKEVLRAADAAELALLDMRGLKRGTVAIAASQTSGAYWLPQKLVRFSSAYPAIDIKLSLGNTDEVAQAVNSGEAEIGFIEGAIRFDDLILKEVHNDQLIVVVGRDHAWRHKRRVTNDDVLAARWVLRERGSGTRSVFEQALKRAGIPVEKLIVGLELPSNEAIRAAVEAGAGATAISQAVVNAALQQESLFAVPFEPINRPFCLLRHRDRALSKAAEAFLAYE